MEEEIKKVLDKAKDMMHKSVDHTSSELSKIRAGKAMPSMLDGISVEYYGIPTPLSQVASINTPDAKTIAIKPWEKNILVEIEKAIQNSDLGLNPVNDGDFIRLNIPALTEERRKDLVKKAKSEVENGKVSIRNVRKDINDALKKLQKEGASEDSIKSAEEDVQKITDSFISKLDKIFEEKEKDIMTV